MCLLMWKPASVTLTKRDVADYYNHNKDGFGIMWMNPATGNVAWYKMVGSQRATWRAYQRYAAGRDCALHFRMATAGEISVAMAHPFKVTESVMLMHNGILACQSTATRSDTAEFSGIMRRELERHPERLSDASYLEALDDVIGPGNRLLFMRAGSPEPVIVGREKGLDHQGAWYSNTYAWANSYYDPSDWRGGWWRESDLKPEPAPVVTLDARAPCTERERVAVQEMESWLDRYHYADRGETVDYFVDWYGRTDSERVRLRIVLEGAAYGA